MLRIAHHLVFLLLHISELDYMKRRDAGRVFLFLALSWSEAKQWAGGAVQLSQMRPRRDVWILMRASGAWLLNS